jgi:hypothetical protein
MSAAGHGNGETVIGCAPDCLGELILVSRRKQGADSSAVELGMDVVNPDFGLSAEIKIRSKREETGRSNEFASRYHHNQTLAEFRLADQFASRQSKTPERRIEGAQIILIDDSLDLPWRREL